MSLFAKRSRPSEEDASCALCVWARVGDDGRLFCRKKKKEVIACDVCGGYEFDLLKYRPASAPPNRREIIEEFERVMEEERKRS